VIGTSGDAVKYRSTAHLRADDEPAAVVRPAALTVRVPAATFNMIDEHRQCHLEVSRFEFSSS
jgi:hypothetical protein